MNPIQERRTAAQCITSGPGPCPRQVVAAAQFSNLNLGLAANRRYNEWRIRVPEWKAGALTGLGNGIGTIFYLSAMSLSAPVVFPLNASIGLLGGVILTAGVYGEKFDLSTRLLQWQWDQ